MKTWRRLQQIGAVPSRNSVYVLPNTEQCREDFEWLRSEIVALGGEATVFAAEALNEGDDNLVAGFQRARQADYRALKRDADRMLSASRAKRPSPAARRDEWHRGVRRMRERFTEIERIDFFHVPAGQEAAAAIDALERLAVGVKAPAMLDASTRSAAAFRNRRWVTRPRPGVDRLASAWLIRRFIDPKAMFGFVERPAESDVPFDMYTGEFSHHGTCCTFETLTQRFNIADAAVARIAHIVHDLDMKDTRYAPPEAPAVDRLIDGLRALYADDDTLLQHGMGMFEALARSFKRDGLGSRACGYDPETEERTTMMKARAHVSLCALAVLVAIGAGRAAQDNSDADRERVVFVCEHGAAKSVIAAAYFNKIAAERGLPDRATYRGASPQAELSVSALKGLREDGVTVPSAKPSPITAGDVTRATHIFAIGCTLPAHAASSGKADSWNDVPEDQGYAAQRDAIRKHVEHLIDQLQKR